MGAGSPPLLLGIDVGTSQCKSLLLGADGRVLGVGRRPTPTVRGAGGIAEHPASELLAAVEGSITDAVADALAGTGGRAIQLAGIGIASMAEAGLLLDREGRPLGDVHAWHDARPAAEATEIERSVGAAELFARTGLRAGPKTPLARLLWFRRHQPATARRARTWVGVAELVGHALTGRLATNASLACRTMAFDVRSRTWDASLLALAGFHTDLMPPLLPLGREVGGIAPEAATRLRIQAGTPVAIAGHDHLVGAIGAGVVRPGQALDSIGSAEAAMLVLDRATADAAIGAAGFSVGCHAVDGRSYVIGGLQASGSFVDWVRRSVLDLDRDGGYAQFDALLALAPPGPSDIVAGPWLAGRSVPNPNRTIGASFAGLRPEHGRSDLALAAVEAVAFASRWIFDELERVTGRRIARVRVIGGGSRNQRWLGVKRATMPWRLELADDDETVARGAALVGGLAGGAYGSVREAIARAGAPVRPMPIDRRLRTAYEAAYRERFLPFAIRT